MPDAGEQAIQDLQALNRIAQVLNQAVDMQSALDRALAQLVAQMDLETGWIFLREPSNQDKWGGPGFDLVAYEGLPPAMRLDRPEAWDKGCDCQTLCLNGKLEGAYNEVRCSRLGEVSGDRRQLAIHASVPLRSGDQILGILNVAAPSWDSFSERALSLLENAGAQIGSALERARLYDLLQERRAHEQATLLDFTNQLLSRTDLKEIMEYLVEEVQELLGADACALLLPDEANPDILRFAAASGWRSDPVREERRVPADERTGAGRVMRTQRPIILEESDPQRDTSWRPDWLPAEEFATTGIVPLVANGRSVGVLLIEAREPRRLQENELRFLQLAGNQAALALEKARWQQEQIQRQRLEEELAVARQIQLSMLPVSVPQFDGWEFSVHYVTARQVGGDFYDFFELPSETGRPRLGLVVADVAGKGVPAALFMALSRTTIRNVAIGDRTPGAALEKANELILEDSKADLFLSAFYGSLDLKGGELVYCNAGHNPPIWICCGPDRQQELSGDGIVLGVLPEIALEEGAVTLQPGDMVVLYTDGVTEAMNEELEEFGVERLMNAIPRTPETAEDVVKAIVSAVNEHVGEAPRWDDFTLVVARRLPA